MRVRLYKEGDRSRVETVAVHFDLAYPQSAWAGFLREASHALGVEEADGIYEDLAGAPVHRVVSLVDGGLYFIRPTESCALLRSLTAKPDEFEAFPAWPSIDHGLAAKDELRDAEEWLVQFDAMRRSQHKGVITGSGEIRAGNGTGDEAEERGDDDVEEGRAMRVKPGFS